MFFYDGRLSQDRVRFGTAEKKKNSGIIFSLFSFQLNADRTAADWRSIRIEHVAGLWHVVKDLVHVEIPDLEPVGV